VTPRFLVDPPRFLFFTGKGGVGKTSLACAAAVRLAGASHRVLLVSTDPASNVGQVFGLTVGDQITAIAAVPGLDALEIDPEAAATAYRESIVGPVRDLLPAAEIASITEQLSGSCTTEIASFNEFTGLLADDERIGRYDHVVFDTAPTGHTIRLLQLPGDWTAFLDGGKGDASCLGPMAGLNRTRTMYAVALQRLCDPALTKLVLVTRAQPSSLAEAARTATELQQIGLHNQVLVVNAVLPEADPGDPADRLHDSIRVREQAALAGIPEALAQLPVDQVPLRARTVMGVDALRSLLSGAESLGPQGSLANPSTIPEGFELGVRGLVDDLRAAGHGLVMCMGKGGVGKTTVAAAIAVALAEHGIPVHLTTTDPAGHLTDALGEGAEQGAGQIPGLTVSRIDPHEATANYRERVLRTKGATLDADGKARLAEDLQSPCTEEVAVFQQFSRLVHESRRHIVVMDTAPTGHTLLLMDATGSYHRDVVRTMGEGTAYTTPLMRLQDPAQTRVVIVTLPDATPVLEAQGLAADLERAGITPWAWVVNASLAAAAPTSDLLHQRATAELPHLARVRELAAGAGRRTPAVIPMLPTDPVGEAALSRLSALDQPTPLPA
jgi:arsenite-transporting ATPase